MFMKSRLMQNYEMHKNMYLLKNKRKEMHRNICEQMFWFDHYKIGAVYVFDYRLRIDPLRAAGRGWGGYEYYSSLYVSLQINSKKIICTMNKSNFIKQ